MRIIGIDPGSRFTGYAIIDVDKGEIRFVDAGALAPDRSAELPVRLSWLAKELEAVIERSSPEQAAVENLFHAVHARSALTLAHARGVILSVLAGRGLPTASYTPLQVKKAVSGYGFADKDALRTLLERMLRIGPRLLSKDASDALAVAVCHAQAAPMREAIAQADARVVGPGAPAKPRSRKSPQRGRTVTASGLVPVPRRSGRA